MLVLYGHNPEDIRTWDALVDRAPTPDVYYRPGYVRAYSVSGHDRPLALVIRSGQTEALFPLLVREFEVNGETVRDAVTPYGYGGVLPLSTMADPEPEAVSSIIGELREWTRASGLAACTIRFHPLLKQETGWGLSRLPEDWWRTFPRGETTAIDLNRWDQSRERICGMRQDRRQDLKRARSCFRFSVASGLDARESLPGFRSLYHQTMERLGADSFFFFADGYYELLAGELGDRFVVITAASDGGPVASSIFLADSQFAHYHLSGSNDEGRRSGAATLVVNVGAEWARQRGCGLLHLGGGLQANDSLWEFKRGFGGDRFWYSYGTLVADYDQYHFLTEHGKVWPYTRPPHPTVNSQASSSSVARQRPLRIGYFADGPWAHRALDVLRSSAHFEVAFIVARYDRPDLVLQDQAQEMGIPFLVHRNVNSQEFLERISPHACDIHVSMSFDQILKAPILASAPEGFINCHAGALPFYKGRNVLNWAIINGERRFGVTVHYIDTGIDTGAIVLQRFADIADSDSYSTLLPRAIDLCSQCLLDALEMIFAATVRTTAQSTIHPLGFYCCPRRDGDEWIDWQWDSRRIYNFVRGITPPSPGARTNVNGNTVAILECQLIKGAPSYIGIPGEIVGRSPDGNMVKTGDSVLLLTQIANVGKDGVLEEARVPRFPISTRMGVNLRARVEELEARVEELTQMLQQMARAVPG